MAKQPSRKGTGTVPSPDFTASDLLTELQDLMTRVRQTDEEGGWLTTLEMADSLAINRDRVRILLKALLQNNRLESRRVWRVNIMGEFQRTPAYRLRDDEGEAKEA